MKMTVDGVKRTNNLKSPIKADEYHTIYLHPSYAHSLHSIVRIHTVH